MNRRKGVGCCALALAMLCLSLSCPAEEAPLPAETAAPILTEASPEAEATPEIAEPAVTESAEPEPTATPEPAATPEPTATPEPAVTPEPEETPLPETPAPEVTPAPGPSIGFLSASHALAHVGQKVEWRFHAENAGKLSYCITNAAGSAVASGELAPDARQVRWAPGEAGEYQITLTAEGAGVVSVCSSVSVVAALAGELTGLNPSYFAGDALTFTAAVSGGASPLAYRMTAEWNGEIFAQEERADSRFALTLPGADAAGMLRIQVVCVDAIGERLTLDREIPCAVHQRETRRQWEKASYVRKSGCWPRDLVAVAETQLGYEESTQDFIIDAAGNVRGYTRYGDWWQEPYRDWCAMFVSFCLTRAGVPRDAFPQEASSADWIALLQSRELYDRAGEAVPEVGDVIFFDMDGNGAADHVGVVTDVDESCVATLEGNSYGGVRRQSYALSAPEILGYGRLNRAYRNAIRQGDNAPSLTKKFSLTDK